MDFIHFGGKTIVGLVGKRGRDDSFYTGAASCIPQKARINAIAGNDPESVWNIHETRLTMDRRSIQARLRLTSPPPLDVQLGERLLQGSLNGRAAF